MVADEFGQLIRGLHSSGDTGVSTDTYLGVVGLDDNATPKYRLLQFVDATGELKVTTSKQYQVDDAAGANDLGILTLVIRDDALTSLTPLDGDYVGLRVGATGALWTTFTNSSITVNTHTLDYTTDSVAIKGSTGNQLAVNSDGSINVALSGASNNIYKYGPVTAVKDTPLTVVTETPASATEYFKAILVSGAGLCEWNVYFGATGSEAVIMSYWTTPSHPTEYIDIPDSLAVTTAQTIYVQAINREKGASTGSDFTAKATLIRNA